MFDGLNSINDQGFSKSLHKKLPDINVLLMFLKIALKVIPEGQSNQLLLCLYIKKKKSPDQRRLSGDAEHRRQGLKRERLFENLLQTNARTEKENEIRHGETASINHALLSLLCRSGIILNPNCFLMQTKSNRGSRSPEHRWINMICLHHFDCFYSFCILQADIFCETKYFVVVK